MGWTDYAVIAQSVDVIKPEGDFKTWFASVLGLLILAGTLGFRWLINSNDRKDQRISELIDQHHVKMSELAKESKLERKEDQKLFLEALAARDALIAALTTEVRNVNDSVKAHHQAMTAAHAAESEKYVALAVKEAVQRALDQRNKKPEEPKRESLDRG